MRAVAAIVRATLRQILGVRRMLGLGILVLAPAGIFFLASRTGNVLETFAGLAVGLLFSIAIPVVTLILASTALGEERRDNTLSFIVLRPLPRSGIGAAKLAAAIGAASTLTTTGAVAMGAVLGLRTSQWGYVLPLVIGAVIATVTYAAIFVPLGYITERATLLGLGFVFIWESAVAGTISGLAGTSPWRIGFSAFVGLAPSEIIGSIPDFALGDLSPSAGGAVIRAVVVLGVCLWATTFLLRKRDLA